MKSFIGKIFATFVAVFCSAFILNMTSCGSSSSGSTVTISGTVSVPTTTATSASLPELQASNAELLGLDLQSAIVDAAGCVGCTATAYDIAGLSIGEATVGSDGSYSLVSPLDAGEHAVFIESVNADSTINMSCYGQVTITEGEDATLSVDCDTDSTLAFEQMFESMGCAFRSDCTAKASGVDLLCDYKAKKALWKLADVDGVGLTDEMAAMKAAFQGCMGGGCSTVTDMRQFKRDMFVEDSGFDVSSYSSEIATQTGFDQTALESKFSDARSASKKIGSYFLGISGSTDAGIAAFSLQGLAKATSGTACDTIKNDTNYAASIAGTIGAADDVDTFSASFIDKSDSKSTLFNLMNKYKGSDGVYDLGKFDPHAIGGQFIACTSADYASCIDDTKMDQMKALYDSNFDNLGTMTPTQRKEWGRAMTAGSDLSACTASNPDACKAIGQLVESQVTTSDYNRSNVDWSTTFANVDPSTADLASIETCKAACATDACKQGCFGADGANVFEAPADAVIASSCNSNNFCEPFKGETATSCAADCAAPAPVSVTLNISDYTGNYKITANGGEGGCVSDLSTSFPFALNTGSTLLFKKFSSDSRNIYIKPVTETTCLAGLNMATPPDLSTDACDTCTISNGTGGAAGTTITIAGCSETDNSLRNPSLKRCSATTLVKQ